MIHESNHGDHGTAGNGSAVFSSADWDKIRADDRQAGKHIVVLMTTIFLLGLIGYLTIDLLIS